MIPSSAATNKSNVEYFVSLIDLLTNVDKNLTLKYATGLSAAYIE